MAIKIPYESVESSTIKAIGYDPQRQICAIHFKSKGQIRHYAGFSPWKMLEFYSAPSKGKFFNERIRGKYQVEPMTGDCPKCGDHGWIGERCEDCGCAEYVAPVGPILHYVFHDEPSATSKKLQRAACGEMVDPKVVARVAPVTCPKCLEARNAYEAMDI